MAKQANHPLAKLLLLLAPSPPSPLSLRPHSSSSALPRSLLADASPFLQPPLPPSALVDTESPPPGASLSPLKIWLGARLHAEPQPPDSPKPLKNGSRLLEGERPLPFRPLPRPPLMTCRRPFLLQTPSKDLQALLLEDVGWSAPFPQQLKEPSAEAAEVPPAEEIREADLKEVHRSLGNRNKGRRWAGG